MLDTQSPGITGLFFNRQTPDALQTALLDAANRDWDYHRIRQHALTHFTETAFFNKLDTFLSGVLDTHMAEAVGIRENMMKRG